MKIVDFNHIRKAVFLYKKIEEYRKKLQYTGKWPLNKIMDYERKWRYFINRYDQIYIYGIEFVGIGETVSRLFMYIHDAKKRDKNSYHIVLPIFYPDHIGNIFNKSVFSIFGQYMHFITEDNLFFWLFVSIMHSGKINLDYFEEYKWRKAKVFQMVQGRKDIRFNAEMQAYAKEKENGMGIRKKYVCLHAREVATKENNFYQYPDTSAADADINSFRKACEYIKGLGYQAVRMGKDENRKCKLEGVIDYANNYYDSLMDFWLLSNCEFMVGCGSGLSTISGFFGSPVLLTNIHMLVDGYESLALTKYDLYIPKKFYSRRKKRFLNLYEMLEASNWCGRINRRFDERGIAILDNTEEEIKDAVVEMHEKLVGIWNETEEEKLCMEKYWKILTLWKSRHKTTWEWKCAGKADWGYVMIPMPICYNYLKKNIYLLDIGDDELE